MYFYLLRFITTLKSCFKIAHDLSNVVFWSIETVACETVITKVNGLWSDTFRIIIQNKRNTFCCGDENGWLEISKVRHVTCYMIIKTIFSILSKFYNIINSCLGNQYRYAKHLSIDCIFVVYHMCLERKYYVGFYPSILHALFNFTLLSAYIFILLLMIHNF